MLARAATVLGRAGPTWSFGILGHRPKWAVQSIGHLYGYIHRVHQYSTIHQLIKNNKKSYNGETLEKKLLNYNCTLSKTKH